MSEDDKRAFIFAFLGSILQEFDAEIPYMPRAWDSEELVALVDHKVFVHTMGYTRDYRKRRWREFDRLKDMRRPEMSLDMAESLR